MKEYAQAGATYILRATFCFRTKKTYTESSMTTVVKKHHMFVCLLFILWAHNIIITIIILTWHFSRCRTEQMFKTIIIQTILGRRASSFYSTVSDTFRYVLKCFEVLPLTLLFKITQHPTVLENKKGEILMISKLHNIFNY